MLRTQSKMHIGGYYLVFAGQGPVVGGVENFASLECHAQIHQHGPNKNNKSGRTRHPTLVTNSIKSSHLQSSLVPWSFWSIERSVRPVPRSAAELFTLLDADCNGFVDEEEFIRSVLPDEYIKD